MSQQRKQPGSPTPSTGSGGGFAKKKPITSVPVDDTIDDIDQALKETEPVKAPSRCGCW